MIFGFKGQYSHSMDKKRRVSIPAKMRNRLGNKVVITKASDGECLVAYPLQEWEKRAERLQAMPEAKKEARAMARIILGAASEIDIDKLGRILVPEYLTGFAGLKKDVEIIGLGNRIEFWDKKKWELYSKKMERDLPSLIEKLAELGV